MADDNLTASQRIDARIAEIDDWRGETLAQIRAVIKRADPDVVEEWKWRGVPVWSHAGMICTGETYKAAVKMTFAKGASLPDPSGLFNSSLEGNTRRAIDFHEGDVIDEEVLADLIQAAIELNMSRSRGRVNAASRFRLRQPVTGGRCRGPDQADCDQKNDDIAGQRHQPPRVDAVDGGVVIGEDQPADCAHTDRQPGDDRCADTFRHTSATNTAGINCAIPSYDTSDSRTRAFGQV